MKILALDLGTRTGWAVWNGVTRTSGTLDLLPDSERRKSKLDKGALRTMDPRPRRLLDFIKKVNPDLIVFEDVQFASTQLQAQLWGSLRGVVMTFQPPVSIVAVSVGTLKKFATGSGRAEKFEMAQALCTDEPGRFLVEGAGEKLVLFHECRGESDHGRVADDNEIDAIWLLKFMLANSK